MFYGSIDGVKDNLPKLRKYVKDQADPGFAADLDISHQTVERVLVEITDQINAALAQRYMIPFADPVPSVITLITNDLAAFKIARSYMTTISAEDNHQLNAMRKDAKEILISLVNGEYEIPEAQKKDLIHSIERELRKFSDADEFFDFEDVSTWQIKV